MIPIDDLASMRGKSFFISYQLDGHVSTFVYAYRLKRLVWLNAPTDLVLEFDLPSKPWVQSFGIQWKNMTAMTPELVEAK